jgi:hypothetical protein
MDQKAPLLLLLRITEQAAGIGTAISQNCSEPNWLLFELTIYLAATTSPPTVLIQPPLVPSSADLSNDLQRIIINETQISLHLVGTGIGPRSV